MKNIIRFTAIAALVLSFGIITANAQKKTPSYKITDVQILPFDEQTGQFQSEITANSDRAFFNDLHISMLVKVEVSGTPGSFEAGRKLEITVMEGKKLKKKRFDQIGLIGEGGKYYVPLWLDAAMCDGIKITARIFVGSKAGTAVTRKVPFMCGE
jgi:hypothetical protein